MTVYKVLTDITDALRASHLEHEAIRAEMATKKDLAAEAAAIRAEMATKKDLAAEMAAVRGEMATKAEMAKVVRGREKLGLEFEAFRHDTRITLEMISELMARTGRHDRAIARLDRRVRRVEGHLELQPLPNGTGDQ